MSGKVKFPREVALQAVRQMLPLLTDACEQLTVAGSLRRRKLEVGDIEIVYVAKHGQACLPGDLMPGHHNLVDVAIATMEHQNMLRRRENAKGAEMFGEKNKYLTHVPTGIPVDFFATTSRAWHNYLVCRTGPGESNIRISARAQERGYQWKPYRCGFLRRSDGEMIPMDSERQVFEFVGLEYLEPEFRQ